MQKPGLTSDGGIHVSGHTMVSIYFLLSGHSQIIIVTMYSDASNLAMGVVLGNQWSVYPFTDEMSHILQLPIHVREGTDA